MAFNLENAQNVLSFVVGITGAVLGSLAWYRGAVEKGYAASRDFAHLRRNQETIGNEIVAVDKAVEALHDEMMRSFHAHTLELVQIKSALNALSRGGKLISDREDE